MHLHAAFYIILLFVSFCSLNAQGPVPTPFDNLLNSTWSAGGEWSDGKEFKQDVTFSESLGGALILAETKGFVGKAQKHFGPRSIGTRICHPASDTCQFYEFDISGGITEGLVWSEGRDLIYQYRYGDMLMTDYWTYINDDTFDFTVGVRNNGSWEKVYLNSRFVRKGSKSLSSEMVPMEQILVGDWSTPAWDGTLNETWRVGEDGHLVSSVQYYEEDKLVYDAATKIESIGGEIVLFSVIADSNPKIFKATDYGDDFIVFENTEYANPRWVTYRFNDDGSWTRTISGIEEGKPISYTFEFAKKTYQE